MYKHPEGFGNTGICAVFAALYVTLYWAYMRTCLTGDTEGSIAHNDIFRLANRTEQDVKDANT